MSHRVPSRTVRGAALLLWATSCATDFAEVARYSDESETAATAATSRAEAVVGPDGYTDQAIRNMEEVLRAMGEDEPKTFGAALMRQELYPLVIVETICITIILKDHTCCTSIT